MEINLAVSGLVFDIIGVFILTLVTIFDYPHQRVYGQPLGKRYWWMGWNPLFKIHPTSAKSKWKVKWNHMIVREGIIPPKYQWNIIGFMLVLAGFILQLKFYLT